MPGLPVDWAPRGPCTIGREVNIDDPCCGGGSSPGMGKTKTGPERQIKL